jgi:hypothetical protein
VEQVIQTFKVAFIGALTTTDSNFLLHLWDKLTPQVMNTLNMMRAFCVNLAISAYKALNSLYDWNQYLFAPLGCKAVIYEDGDTPGSWASCGVDGWYLGPSLNHYRCALYYLPETRAYLILGSTELFPQHCQLPVLMPHQHLCELTEELATKGSSAGNTTKLQRLLKCLKSHIENILTLLPPCPVLQPEQRMEQRVSADEQRVIDNTPIPTL